MKTPTTLANSRLALLRTLTAATAVAAFAFAASPAQADDRDILRDSSTRPYVFFVLDTSGSMNWSPKCTQAQVDAGICTFLCPTGDCPVPRDGDDPASKFRQSKEALYEVLRDVDDVDFGFATYNQDQLAVSNKHWLFRVRAGEPQVTLSSGAQFPAHGSEEVFGATLACDRGNDDDSEMGCFATSDRAADTNDVWEMTKVRRLPKLGVDTTTAVSFYIRDGGRVYYVTYDDPGSAQDFNGDIQVRIRVDRCTGTPANDPSNGCNSSGERTLVGTVDVKMDRIGDFIMWDFRVSRTWAAGQSSGWFGAQDSSSGNTCAGWDPNDDSTADRGVAGDSDSNLKFLTIDDPATPDRDPVAFDYGDVLPLDWQRDNKGALLDRLASRLNGGDPTSDPEAFGNATYLANGRAGGEAFLRLANSTQHTLVPSGSTPLGYTLGSFRSWYRGCLNGSCPSSTGWDDIAATNDPTWACRQKFLVVLTDGDDTCPGRDPCSFTASMRAQDGILTYVVAFGLENTAGNKLNCMAANGGTGDPIYPQNKQELVDALQNILGQIREQAAAFASAAVPQVQANATDKIFLSSFTPVQNSAYWAGRLDAFLKPLPLDVRGQPDRSVVCSPSVRSACFLWDAGDVQAGHRDDDGIYAPQRLLEQAPHPDDVTAAAPWDASELQLGTEADERRLVYTQWSEPGNRRLFTFPDTLAQSYDLWNGFGLSYIAGDTGSEAAATAVANETIVTTLLEKEAIVSVPDPDSPGNFEDVPLTYLMGDIFHADPLVVSKPSNFSYYVGDPYLNKRLCAADPDPDRFPPVSYKWFADKHVCRRTLLVAGANDGQLHVFDGGLFRALGSTTAECLLPAKDLDGDGNSEADEWGNGLVDYDINDDVERSSERCSTDGDCESGDCLSSGFCSAQSCVANADCDSNLCLDNGFCSGGNGVIDGAYDNGTGREIFSFMPRAMMRTVRGMAKGADRNRDFWGLDGSPRIDDVFIDPEAAEDNLVTCENREWRSVAIGGYREGGPGYYALDITQPDILNSVNVPQPVEGYVPSCFDGGGACDNRPYPSVLWEFQDTQPVEIGGVTTVIPLDEDLNGSRDLSNSWSRPTTGRIRVCTGSCTADETEDRFVAVFGGGVGDNPSPAAGNYIYMVDVETGKVIYKKPVIGAVPADIAAIDTNGDSYLDRLYVGTVSGFVYKVEFDSPTTPMLIQNQTLTTRYFGVNYTFEAERLIGPTGDTRKYDPFQVFTTGGRAIYHEIAAVYVASKNRVAMAFGTGDRWNLWNFDGQRGRFYVLLDDNFHDTDRDGVLNITCSGCTQPLTEAKYVAIDPDAAFDPSAPDFYLFDGDGAGSLPGWYFTMLPNEKVITEAFSLAGVTIFTSFVPTEVANDDGTCSRAGTSRIFIVGTVTALGYNIPEGGTILDRVRYTEVPQFTTPPFVEQSATANPEAGGSGDQHADFITESLALIRDELKSLQSSRCRYANYTQNIKTIRSDTGLVFVAPIPLCIDPTSWKEF